MVAPSRFTRTSAATPLPLTTVRPHLCLSDLCCVHTHLYCSASPLPFGPRLSDGRTSAAHTNCTPLLIAPLTCSISFEHIRIQYDIVCIVHTYACTAYVQYCSYVCAYAIVHTARRARCVRRARAVRGESDVRAPLPRYVRGASDARAPFEVRPTCARRSKCE